MADLLLIAQLFTQCRRRPGSAIALVCAGLRRFRWSEEHGTTSPLCDYCADEHGCVAKATDKAKATSAA